MMHPLPPSGPSLRDRLGRYRQPVAFALIAVVIGTFAAAFAATAGWFTPSRLSGADVADTLEQLGAHPGFRRAHQKGVCVVGHFDSNGQGQALSKAGVFVPGRVPVFGRFALAVGTPYSPDGVPAPRSLALNFTQADGDVWRMAMNHVPLFPVGTARDFVALQQATAPVPGTGKPDPARVAAFMAAHPETRAFGALMKSTPTPSSFVNGSYYSINAFRFVDAGGRSRVVRWSLAPEAAFAALDRSSFDALNAQDPNFLFNELFTRLHAGPQRWHLLITLAEPGDRSDNATVQWPATRTQVDVGTLVIDQAVLEENGPCRNVTFDPLILPAGIAASDDPLLSARSAAYAVSLRRRSGEPPQPSALARDYGVDATSPEPRP